MIDIEIGEYARFKADVAEMKKISDRLLKIGEDKKNQIGVLFQQQIMKNIQAGNDAGFMPFKPLSDATKNRKSPPRGGETAKPLMDLGFLLGGFSFEFLDDGILFENSQSYAVYHQNGTEFIPKRTVFPEVLEGRWLEIILAVLDEDFDKLTE